MTGLREHTLKPLVIGAAILALGWIDMAGAQALKDPPRPDPAKGLALAQRLCSTCHLTSGANATPVTAGIPSLAAIANRAGQTRAAIEGTLISPPHPMPDVQLTRDQITDIIAYLDQLRTDRAAPPWTPRGPGDLPTYPKPS